MAMAYQHKDHHDKGICWRNPQIAMDVEFEPRKGLAAIKYIEAGVADEKARDEEERVDGKRGGSNGLEAKAVAKGNDSAHVTWPLLEDPKPIVSNHDP
jgi:hypothetical protein